MTARQAMQPVNFGLPAPNRVARTAECTPSAPISRRPRAVRPPANSAVTPAASCSTPVQAALFVRKQATVLGVQSADIGQFWKALEFVRRTSARYDFEAMLTTRFPLDRINDAIQNMRAFREIKPLVLPWAS